MMMMKSVDDCRSKSTNPIWIEGSIYSCPEIDPASEVPILDFILLC